jgi:hypothetical protein
VSLKLNKFQYKTSSFFSEVFYDDMAAKEGCTVDLLVNETDRALFTAKMKNNNTDCISEASNEVGIVVKSNDNLWVF